MEVLYRRENLHPNQKCLSQKFWLSSSLLGKQQVCGVLYTGIYLGLDLIKSRVKVATLFLAVARCASTPRAFDALVVDLWQILPLRFFYWHVQLTSSFSSCFTVTPLVSSLTQMPNPRTAPIIPGQECVIEIPKGNTGLGLSIVGGADTLLVSSSCVN